MSVLEFLLRGKRRVTVAYFNHGTSHGDEAEEFIREFCASKGLPCVIGKYPDGGKPTEADWRRERYKFLAGFDVPVITAHHLKDAVEWWIFSALRGNPTLTPVIREDIPVLRPFLLTAPNQLWDRFIEYPHIEDPTNILDSHARNIIRNNIMQDALRINPGLFTTVKNLYEKNSV
jgi:tRNA(Ile)-lysidine synthase TilS/MesJ